MKLTPAMQAAFDQEEAELAAIVQRWVTVARDALAGGADRSQLGPDLQLAISLDGHTELALRCLLATAVIQLAEVKP